MRYRFTYLVEPPSYFGLPEEGKTVISAIRTPEVVSPALDTRTGDVIGYGTLSQYRTDEEALRLQLEVGDVEIRANDNAFRVEVESDSLGEAEDMSRRTFEKLIRHLITIHGDYYRFRLLRIEDGEGNPLQSTAPRTIGVGAFTWYNIEELGGRLEDAARRAVLEDSLLERALLYYEHARFLFNSRGSVPLLGPHDYMILTASYLHLWKAITCLLGEPGTDPDYQSRFREFGLPRTYWEDSLKPLYDVRCSYDVAHYSLDESATERVARAWKSADRVAKEVIGAYSEHLLNHREDVG